MESYIFLIHPGYDYSYFHREVMGEIKNGKI